MVGNLIPLISRGGDLENLYIGGGGGGGGGGVKTIFKKGGDQIKRGVILFLTDKNPEFKGNIYSLTKRGL